MKVETLDLICHALDGLDIEYSRRDDYSGRGMYGKTTGAVVVAGWSDWSRAVALAAANLARDVRSEVYSAERDLKIKEFVREAGEIASDAMGRDSIVIY